MMFSGLGGNLTQKNQPENGNITFFLKLDSVYLLRGESFVPSPPILCIFPFLENFDFSSKLFKSYINIKRD